MDNVAGSGVRNGTETERGEETIGGLWMLRREFSHHFSFKLFKNSPQSQSSSPALSPYSFIRLMSLETQNPKSQKT
jgi:hypothetical protein